MLMQNFLSAEALDLTEEQKRALEQTLVLMETGQLVRVDERKIKLWPWSDEPPPRFCGLFNMAFWSWPIERNWNCDTIACLGGTACLLAGDPDLFNEHLFDEDGRLRDERPTPLRDLFYPAELNHCRESDYNAITVTQAARALRNYLTTGHAMWDEVLA